VIGVSLPESAVEALTGVSEAVIDAAVETDVRPPISGVPHIDAIAPSPISWSPEQAYFRRFYPDARYPVISVRAVCPVTGLPDVAVAGTSRLYIYR
jgi:hypothetical protein